MAGQGNDDDKKPLFLPSPPVCSSCHFVRQEESFVFEQEQGEYEEDERDVSVYCCGLNSYIYYRLSMKLTLLMMTLLLMLLLL